MYHCKKPGHLRTNEIYRHRDESGSDNDGELAFGRDLTASIAMIKFRTIRMGEQGSQSVPGRVSTSRP